MNTAYFLDAEQIWSCFNKNINRTNGQFSKRTKQLAIDAGVGFKLNLLSLLPQLNFAVSLETHGPKPALQSPKHAANKNIM